VPKLLIFTQIDQRQPELTCAGNNVLTRGTGCGSTVLQPEKNRFWVDQKATESGGQMPVRDITETFDRDGARIHDIAVQIREISNIGVMCQQRDDRFLRGRASPPLRRRGS
jgi:hypothetical protein